MTRYENDSCARICGPVLSCVSVWWNGHLENDASHPFTFTLEGLPLGRTRKRGVYRRRQLLALADLVSVRGVKLMSPRCAVRLYCLHDFSMTWFSLMMESTATVETGSKKFESIEQRLLRTILASYKTAILSTKSSGRTFNMDRIQVRLRHQVNLNDMTPFHQGVWKADIMTRRYVAYPILVVGRDETILRTACPLGNSVTQNDIGHCLGFRQSYSLN